MCISNNPLQGEWYGNGMGLSTGRGKVKGYVYINKRGAQSNGRTCEGTKGATGINRL